MEEVISKEEFDELMNLQGEVKGTGIKTHGEFILKEEGEEGLKKLEKVMAQLGYPIEFEKVKSTTLYPFGVEATILVVIKRLFKYDDKKFQEMGRFHAKGSLIIRLFMKYFVSLDRMTKEAQKIWERYFTTGVLKVVEIDEEGRRLVFRIENFRFHPLHCKILMGSLPTVVQMIIGKPVKCEETKCIYRGDDYHEFLVTW